MILRAFRWLWRSAVTGKFVSRDFAREHPREPMRERIHSPRPSRRAD